MLMGGIASAWLLYEMATATEAPSRALAVLQYRASGLCADWADRLAGHARFGKVTALSQSMLQPI
jgi:hypothetical protein